MSPIAEKIRQSLNDSYETLDREKLTRWLMSRASNTDLGIVNCHGQSIGVGLGCKFEGSVRLIFWSFIKPCIVANAQAACDALDATLHAYSPSQRCETLDSVEAHLKSYATRIYTRMVDLDRRMRGNGFPDQVPPYDPSKEITDAHEMIAHKLATLRAHYVNAPPTSLLAKGKAFWMKHWQWIIAVMLIPLLGQLLRFIG